MNRFKNLDKLPHIATTIFTKMSALANKYNAINLSQGFPDFPIDPELQNALKEVILDNNHQYAPLAGVPELTEAIANKIQNSYGLEVSAEREVTVTAGATQAIFTAITAIIKPEDEVIIFSPSYDCYAPTVELAGGIVKEVRLQEPDFCIPWEEVKNVFTQKTKLIIINTPNNPTGRVLSKFDLEQLEDLVVSTNALVLSDEVYEHIIYEREHESVLKYPNLYSRSFAIFSFGKTFHVTGWKLGYVVAPEDLTAVFRKVHQFNVFCVNRPVQMAIAKYIQNPDNYLSLSVFYKEKKDLFQQIITSSPFELLPCDGTYFQMVSFNGLTDEDDYSLAERLTKEVGVASIPISSFYLEQPAQNYLRFCFAKKSETLERAGEKLAGLTF